MGQYQEMFESLLKEHFTGKLCIELAIESCLRKKDHGLSGDDIKRISRKLAEDPSAKIETSDLSIDEDAEILIDLTEQDLEASVERIKNAASEVVRTTAEEIAPGILEAMKSDSETAIKLLKEELDSFHENIHHAWGPALDSLELYINASREARDGFIQDYQQWDEERVRDSSNKAAALVRIHMRACRTAAEILCLLRGGFADGASARWRALHELSVIGMYLSEQPDSVSEMFLDHNVIEQAKSMGSYETHCESLGEEPIEKEGAELLRQERDVLITKYGPPFKGDYGWASCHRQEKRTTFSDIEQSVQLDHWRPYYRLACQSIHAGSRGCFFSLGALSEDELASSRALAGLCGPGQNCAISLSMVSAALLTFESTIDQLIAAQVLAKMCGQVTQSYADRSDFLDDHLIEIPEDVIQDDDN